MSQDGLPSSVDFRIVPPLSKVPVKSLGTTGPLNTNPSPNKAGALRSAGILDRYITALLGASHCTSQTQLKLSTGPVYARLKIDTGISSAKSRGRGLRKKPGARRYIP